MKHWYSSLTPQKQLFVVLGAGLCLTLGTGVVCGRISQRWGPAPDMMAAANLLKDLPTQIGEWKSTEGAPLSKYAQETLACSGFVSRQYINQRTGEKVEMAIIVGPSGPMSVHTPEICYSSQAYEIHEPREATSIEDAKGNSHDFWRLRFRSPSPTAEQLCVYYAWNAEKKWEASESPRFEYAGRPMLFKLQMSSLVPPGPVKHENVCAEFLRELLNSGWKVNG
jgi:hypothetical protein